jgi:hypothetical protein
MADRTLWTVNAEPGRVPARRVRDLLGGVGFETRSESMEVGEVVSDHALIAAAQKVWPFPEHPPLDMGVEDGIVWAIARAPTAGINGYCLIPAEGHPWSNGTPQFDDDDYEGMDALLDVHGGITYGGCGGSNWIGFDTCHAGDIWDDEYDPYRIMRNSFGHYGWDKHWTLELVADEVKSLARQIANRIEPVTWT